MRKISIRMLLAVAILGGLGVATVPAHAAPAKPLVCTIAAASNIQKNPLNNNYTWAIDGAGQCVNPATTSVAHLTAAGSSVGLGLCDGGLVQNLNLNVVLTLTSTNTGLVTTSNMKFVSPISTYPVVTPFLVRSNGAITGAGALSNHIFLACPPLGTPSTEVVFAVVL